MSDNGKRLSDFRPQKVNANKGKPIGLTQLDKSIRRDGYSAAMTAAADGGIFAGSKRLERSADVFGLDVEPIVIHSDGTRPIIHVRDDIPTADDPRAVRLGVADNAIAHMDYDPDGAVLAALAAQDEAIAEMARCDDVSRDAVMTIFRGETNNNQSLITDQWIILIECESEHNQTELLDRFNAEGLRCRALIS